MALLALFGSLPRDLPQHHRHPARRRAGNGGGHDRQRPARRAPGQAGAGGLLGLGLIFALITASGAVGAAIRSLEAINGTRKSATFVRSNLTRLWLTLALMVLFLVAFTSLLVAGPLFGSIAESAGFGDAGRTAVSLSRYPIGLAALLLATLLLYALGPRGTRRRLVEHLPGALLAALLWVIASAGFSFYVSNFGSYDATYGTLGAVIVLLVWIYVGGIAFLWAPWPTASCVGCAARSA